MPDGDKANFDNAWLNYHSATRREIDETYTHYMNFSGAGLNSFGGVWHRKNIGRETFKRNVARFLSFAARS